MVTVDADGRAVCCFSPSSFPLSSFSSILITNTASLASRKWRRRRWLNNLSLSNAPGLFTFYSALMGFSLTEKTTEEDEVKRRRRFCARRFCCFCARVFLRSSCARQNSTEDQESTTATEQSVQLKNKKWLRTHSNPKLW